MYVRTGVFAEGRREDPQVTIKQKLEPFKALILLLRSTSVPLHVLPASLLSQSEIDATLLRSASLQARLRCCRQYATSIDHC